MCPLPVLLSLLWGCSTHTLELAETPEPDASVIDAALDASEEDSSVAVSLCMGAQCACSNGVDDDGDGYVDGFDPECSYSLDDDEGSFATGAHDESGLKNCQDCFFDSNASERDDGCKRSPTCQGDGDRGRGCGPSCLPDDKCVESCAARAPNGCDCFGCCEVHMNDGQLLHVRLTATCKYDEMALSNPNACPRCVPSESCRNECEPCEPCLGKTIAQLPPQCGSSGEGYTCSGGQLCGESKPCPDMGYCYLGCCLPAIVY